MWAYFLFSTECWLGRVYFKAHWTRCSSWSLLRTWKVNMQKQIASQESISSWTEMTRTFLRFLVWRKWILMMWDLYNISLSVSFVRPPNVIYLSLPKKQHHLEKKKSSFTLTTRNVSLNAIHTIPEGGETEYVLVHW